jgi:RNA polymerase sigma factor (sigma-70 family)
MHAVRSHDRPSRHILSVTGDAAHPMKSEAPEAPTPLQTALEMARPLEGFLRRRGHGDAAPDLVQDLFLLLLSKPSGLNASEKSRFRSFLFAIAYRIGANASRARRREDARHANAARPGEGVWPARDADPETRALLREKARRAVAALQALPADTRKTLLLVADDGRSTAETAQILGVSEDVVRARLCRGRRRLAAILDAKER